MKSWGMWATNGSIWTSNKKNLIIKWRLKIKPGMINSLLNSHKCLKLLESTCLTSGDLEGLSIIVKIKVIHDMIFTILTINVLSQDLKNLQLKIRQSIKLLNKKIMVTYITLKISSLYLKGVQWEGKMNRTSPLLLLM